MNLQTDFIPKTQSKQIYGLDFIRFFAALLVCLYHLAFKPVISPGDELHTFFSVTSNLPPGYSLTWFGWVGVQIFFVLSGFVIAYSCQGESTRDFVIKRFLRLVPGMWVSASICFILAVLLEKTVVLPIFLTLKSMIFFPVGPWIAGQIWTLPIELSFYAILAIMLFLNHRDWFEKLAIVLTILSALYWFTYSIHYHDPHTRLTQLLLFQHGCQFAMGLLLWCAVTDRLTPARISLMIVCAVTSYIQIAAVASYETTAYLDRLPLSVPMAVWTAAVVFIYLSGRFNNLADKFLAPHKKIVRQMGLLTYPLYLVHVHIGGAVLLAAHWVSIGFTGSVALALSSAIATSWWISVTPEPALRRFLSHCITSGEGFIRRALALVE